MKLNLSYFAALCANSILPLLLLYICYNIPEWFYLSYCESDFLQYMAGESFLLKYVRWGVGLVNLVLLIIHFAVNSKAESPWKKHCNFIGILLTLSGFYVVLYYICGAAYFILGGGIHTQ